MAKSNEKKLKFYPAKSFSKAMFRVFCKRANCDAQMISGA